MKANLSPCSHSTMRYWTQCIPCHLIPVQSLYWRLPLSLLLAVAIWAFDPGEYSDRPFWGAQGREMTLYCSKSIGVTSGGHYQQKSGGVCLQEEGGYCSCLKDLWCVMWVTWNAICWILVGLGVLTSLWQEAKSTLIYTTLLSKKGGGGPVTQPLQKMYCEG